MNNSPNANTFFLNPFYPKQGKIFAKRISGKRNPLPYWVLDRPSHPKVSIGRKERSQLKDWLAQEGIPFVTENPACSEINYVEEAFHQWFTSHCAYFQWDELKQKTTLQIIENAKEILPEIIIKDITVKYFEQVKRNIYRQNEFERAETVLKFFKDVLIWLSRNNCSIPCSPFNLNTQCIVIQTYPPSFLNVLRETSYETYLALLVLEDSGLDVSYLKYIKHKHLQFSTQVLTAELSIYEIQKAFEGSLRTNDHYGSKIKTITLTGPFVRLLKDYTKHTPFLFREAVGVENTRYVSLVAEKLNIEGPVTFRQIKEAAMIKRSSQTSIEYFEEATVNETNLLVAEVNEFLKWFEQFQHSQETP